MFASNVCVHENTNLYKNEFKYIHITLIACGVIQTNFSSTSSVPNKLLLKTGPSHLIAGNTTSLYNLNIC